MPVMTQVCYLKSVVFTLVWKEKGLHYSLPSFFVLVLPGGIRTSTTVCHLSLSCYLLEGHRASTAVLHLSLSCYRYPLDGLGSTLQSSICLCPVFDLQEGLGPPQLYHLFLSCYLLEIHRAFTTAYHLYLSIVDLSAFHIS